MFINYHNMLKFYHKKLKNKLSLLVIQTKKLSSLDITLYIKSGSVYENEHNQGISHLLEHLLFLNTKQVKLNPIALDIYPYTRKDFTYFEITTHKDLLNTALSNLFSIINSPNFTKENLKLVKNIVREELIEFNENPYDILSQKIDAYLYQGNALSFNIGGLEKSLEGITLSDLKEWYDNYYHPSNMLLSLVGDVNVGEVSKQINKINFNSKLGALAGNKKIDKVIYPLVTKPVYLKNDINTETNYLAFVFPTSGIDGSNYIKFILLAEILNKKIRQSFENSGLLYDISLYYQSYLNAGEFRIVTACKKSNVKKIIEKFDIFLNDSKISSSDFETLKNYIKYQFKLKEDNVDELSALSLYLLKNKPELITLEDEIELIENTSLSEINKLKKKFISKKNSYYFIMN